MATSEEAGADLNIETNNTYLSLRRMLTGLVTPSSHSNGGSNGQWQDLEPTSNGNIDGGGHSPPSTMATRTTNNYLSRWQTSM